jgi:choline transporter-like protein 2/4/5
VLGFTWLMLAKLFTGLFVWITLLLVLVSLGFFTGYAFYKGNVVVVNVPATLDSSLGRMDRAVDSTVYALSEHVGFSEADAQKAWRIIGFIFTAISLVVFAMVITLRKRIATAIGIIKLGSEALRSVWSLVFFPFCTVAGLTAFLLWWVFSAACLATSGDAVSKSLTNDLNRGVAYLEAEYGPQVGSQLMPFLNRSSSNSSIIVIEDLPAMNYLLIAHFFGLLWTTQFVQGLSIMTVAGAIGGWYFSLNETNNPEVEVRRYKPSRFPVIASLWRALRYSFGTIAFGSLLIAFMQFIRAVVAYLTRQMTAKNGGQTSRLFKLVACCVQCCLKCMQACLEVITRNAYIFSAVKGTSFCGSGKKVFGLITSNAATLAIVNILGEVIMFLGKVLIAMCCGWIAFAILDHAERFQPGQPDYISTEWIVILVTVFFAYAVATCFMNVFDLAVDTVLVCYVTDTEETAAKFGVKTPSHVRGDKLTYAGKGGNNGTVSAVNGRKSAKAGAMPAMMPVAPQTYEMTGSNGANPIVMGQRMSGQVSHAPSAI